GGRGILVGGGDRLGPAGGEERGEVLSGSSLAEQRVVPGERVLERVGVEVPLELGLDPSIESIGGEALGDDPVDRDPVLTALSLVGSPELRADAGRQAPELDSQPGALQKIIERPWVELTIGARDD